MTTSRARAALRALALAVVLAMVLPVSAAAKPAEGETATERSIQMARQAAAAGDVDGAIDIYTGILSDDPGNERAFWGLVGVYSSAGMDDVLMPLLERRVIEYPYDTLAQMELGEAHAKAGNHDVAHDIWMHVLSLGTQDVSEYSDIGVLEIRHRMYEQALETFTTGRESFRSESLFSQELTQIHTALGDFDSAIDECLITVDHHSGAVSWATNRIELMLEEGAARGDVRRKMAAVAEDRDATVARLGLAGSVFLVLDLPDRALATFLRADEAGGGHGVELLEYATILKDDGRKDQAREAFLMVVDRHPGESSAAQAGTAAANLLAEAGDPAGAVRELRAVAAAFEGASRGAQALYEAAQVELDLLGEPESALATIAELRQRFGERARALNDASTLIEVDAYMKQGRLDEAYSRASSLDREDVPDDVRESALFALGFISFLEHDYEKAIEEFRTTVKTNPASVLVNDALRLMLILAVAEEAGDTAPVDRLADAHAARLAGNQGESRELLLELADGHAGEAVETEALLLLGGFATVAGDAKDAIAYYDRIISGADGVTARAEAMMRKADILRLKLGRTQDAADQYLAILEELPANTLSGEARRKLDRLRRGEGVEG